jgi:hypothetical protein
MADLGLDTTQSVHLEALRTSTTLARTRISGSEEDHFV